MAIHITRDKSGRITSRKKFTPGTKSSPFKKKSRSSKTRTATEQERKVAEAIAKAFAPKLKEISSKASRGRSTKPKTTPQTLASLTSAQRKQLENLKAIQTSARTEIAARQEREAVAKKKSSSQRKQKAVSFIKSIQSTPQQLQEERISRQEQIKLLQTKGKAAPITKKPFSKLKLSTQDLLKGKSIPITSQTLAIKDLIERNKAIEKEQIRLLKNIPKDVAQAIFDVGKEIVTSGRDVIIGSVNYGRGLVKRSVAIGGGKRPIDFLISDVKKIGKSTGQVANFIRKNPDAALVIVGAASSVLGKNLGKEFVKNPIKTLTKAALILAPGKIIKGGLAVTQKGAQFLTRSKTLENVLHAKRFTNNKFKVTTDLVEGISKVKGDVKGTFLNGKKFTSEYRLTVNTKNKKVTGQIVTKSDKKTFTENINLIDKGGFYLDPKKNIKIPKIRSPIDSRSIKISETKLTPIKGTSQSKLAADGTILQKTDADFITTVTRIIDNAKQVNVRTGQIRLLTSPNTNRIKRLSEQFTKTVGKGKRTTLAKPLTKQELKVLEEFIDNIGVKNLSGLDRRSRVAKALGVTKTSKTLDGFENLFKTRFAKVKVIPQKRITNLKNIITGKEKALSKLKSKSGRKGISLKSEIKTLKNKLVNLSEKRTEAIKRVGRVVDSKEVVIRKGKAVLKGQITTGKKLVKRDFKVKFNIQKRRLSDLKKSKKGQVSLFQNDRIQILKKQGPIFKTDKFIEIPALQSRVPLTIPRLKSLGVLTRATALMTRVALLSKTAQVLSQTELTKQVTQIIEGVKEIQRVIDKQGQREGQVESQKVLEQSKQIQTPIQKQTTKTGRTIKTPPVRLTIPKITGRPLPKGPPKITRLPEIPDFNLLTLNSKLPRGKRLAFDVFYKDKGIVKSLGVKVPQNVALNRLSSLIDSTTSRSAEIRIAGVTKVKDVSLGKGIQKKFRQTKSKNRKALKMVEKRKFGIDTPGEKKGLTIAKAVKKLTKPKQKKKQVKRKSQPKKKRKR